MLQTMEYKRENINVLIVEDNLTLRKSIIYYLNSSGYKICGYTSNGEEAITMAQTTGPDIILMDIMLEGDMDGIEAASRIRSFSNIPIVYITGYVDNDLTNRAKKTDPYGYILKPFNQKEVDSVIEIGLYKHKMEKYLKEEETIKALEKERELSNLKSRFVSMISHDFRTPLATILSSVELLEYYMDNLSEEEKSKTFLKIREAINKMTSLLENVLIINRADMGKLTFNPQELNLDDFCQSLIAEINCVCNNRIIFIRKSLCIKAFMDKYLLRYIFTNILSNAIKYSDSESKVIFQIDCKDKKAVFVIEDKGIGIPLDERDRLFEPFHRSKNVSHIQGTGLGLTIVKRCLELHGGTISFSPQEKGTIFTVTIPCNECEGDYR